MRIVGMRLVLVSFLIALATAAVPARGAVRFKPNIIVAKDNSGHYHTVQAAINAVPPTVSPALGKVIYIKQGDYNETVLIQPYQQYITIVGDPGRTRIFSAQYAGQLNSSGDPLRTQGSGVFICLADHFTAINIIFQNTVPRPPPSTYDRQAVALRIAANYSALYNCSILSYQDTLYAHKGVQYYKNCYIFGEIDFVFGYAKAYFDNCTLEISSLGYGSFTAQHKQQINADNGFVFNKGLLKGYGQGWLGRAWGEFAFTIFANMYMENVVSPDGWQNFGLHSRQVTSYYAEYNNTGIGANLEGRVTWERKLTAAQIAYYLTPNWINLRAWLRPFPLDLPGSLQNPLPPAPPPPPLYLPPPPKHKSPPPPKHKSPPPPPKRKSPPPPPKRKSPPPPPKRKSPPPPPKLPDGNNPKAATGCSFTKEAISAKSKACYSCCHSKHANNAVNCNHYCVYH